MSTIGKIFLVLNLILAGAFVGWAANSLGKNAELKQSHADKIAALDSAKSAAEKELIDTRALLVNERTAKDQTRAERDQLDSEAKRNKEDLDAAKRANDQLRADVAKINETMGGLNTQLQAIEAAKDRATAEARELENQRDEASRKSEAADMARREADENRKKAEMSIEDLQRNLRSTKGDLSKAETQLANLRAATGRDVGSDTAQKAINAVVVKSDYSLKPGLVALNKGSNDGVLQGYTFEIYEGTVYKGQVRVETVHADMCSALVTLAVRNTTIKAGDSAATQL